MNALYRSYFILLLGAASVCQAQQAQQNLQTANLPAATPYSIVSGSRTANSRVWENTTSFTLPSGKIITHLNRFTEVASGLCYQQDNQWLDSQEQIVILPDGSAWATNGQHTATFPANSHSV
jgi:hypothetical protein